MKTSKFFGSANIANAINATTAHDDFDWDDVEGTTAYANNPMHQLMAQYEHNPIKHPTLRDLLTGTIVGKGRKEYFVSIPGVASDAMLPFTEANGQLSTGDSVHLFVHGIVFKSDAPMIVSQKQAESWLALQEAREEGATVQVRVCGVVTRGERVQGLKVSYNNVNGFIPRAQLSRETVIADVVGTDMSVKVLKANPKGRFDETLVVSDKAVANAKLDDVISTFAEGDTVRGIVKKVVTDKKQNSGRETGLLVAIADGAFTAFIHSSEIADNRRPSQALPIDTEFEASIISIDKQKREIKISQRAFQAKGLKEGMLLDAKVLRFKEKVGYFVAIGNGLTALLPASQVSDGNGVDARGMFQNQQVISVLLTELNSGNNRAIVSYKQASMQALNSGEIYTGTINKVLNNTGLYIVVNGVGGLLHFSELGKGERLNNFKADQNIEVSLKAIRKDGDRTLVGWTRKDINE